MQYAKSVHGVMISTKMPCYAILHNMVGSYHHIQSSRVPVEGKSSMCAMCMKYRNNDYIIIIISMGQILLS